MPSDIPVGGWRIKIDYIPTSVTFLQLAQTLDLPKSRVFLPKAKSNDIHYAWINNFIDEEEANKFANRWSGSSIFGETIKCVVFSPKVEKKDTLHSSRESLMSGIEPDKQHGLLFNIGNKGRQQNSNPSTTPASLLSINTNRTSDIKTDDDDDEKESMQLPSHHSNRNQQPSQPCHKPDQPFHQSKTSGKLLYLNSSSVVRRSVKKQDIEDKRPLCRYANKGTCEEKSNECQFRHQRCKNYESCSDLKCPLAHAKEDIGPDPCPSLFTTTQRPCKLKKGERDPCAHLPRSHRSDSCSSISSTQSMNVKVKPCRNGIKCFNMDCKFDHPDGWKPCKYGVKCENYECTASHPYERKAKCRNGDHCENSNCKFLHPTMRQVELKKRERDPCVRLPRPHRSDSCSSISSTQSMNVKAKPCRNGIKCYNVDCEFDHPDGWKPCKYGIKCNNYECTANHPYKRKAKCRDDNNCENSNCKFLHPTMRRVEHKKRERDPRARFPSPHRSGSCSSISSTQSMNVKAKPCRNGIKCFNVDCEFDHPEGSKPCIDGIKCENYECTANHPHKRKAKCRDGNHCENSNCKFLHSTMRPVELKKRERDLCAQLSRSHRSDSCSSISSTQSMNVKVKPCRNGIKCFNVDCKFDHPDGWKPCKYGIKCNNYECPANHPHNRKPKCRDDNNCKNSDCLFLHPNTRPEKCSSHEKCKKWNCQKLHPHTRPPLCANKENCIDPVCSCLHPQQHASLLCPIGADCSDLSCRLNHSPERPPIYDQLNTEIIESKLQEKTTITTTDTTDIHVTLKSANTYGMVKTRGLLSSESKNQSLVARDTQSCKALPTARIGVKATCPVSNGNISHNSSQVDVKYLLQNDNCIYFSQVDAQYFDVDDYELLKKRSLYLCSPNSVKQSAELDQTFNTLVDKPIDARTLIEELLQNHSLKVYVIDSLKRHNSLLDIIHILPSCSELQLTSFPKQHQTIIETFLDIKDTITKSVLLITTIDSISYESQRYFGNFIKKNDLPIPFTYYMWNKEKDSIEYKINFNLLAEIMCLTTGRYILQIGSESTIRMGKTTMLQFIFPDKRLEALNTDGSSALRNGCIDVLFPSDTNSQKNKSYVNFDVHGTINALNEDIITAIQEYCAFQIFYVTEKDLNTTFLNSMMNYSSHIQAKPTIVVIFDPNYDDKHYQADTIISTFQSQYQKWKCVKWVTAPPSELWHLPDNNKKNKDLVRSQRLRKSFSRLVDSMDKEIQQQIHCTSIFSIQSYYLTVKTSKNISPPVNCHFKIQSHLTNLFDRLNEKTENLRITTPVSYLDSAIKQCERELLDNWNAPQKEIQTRKDNLIQRRSNITTINSYTAFFIDLLTKCSYIELLITEKYLEKWRSQFESTLLDQSTEAKNEASKLISKIKLLEERLAFENNLSSADRTTLGQELCNAKDKYNKQRTLVTKINEKLMNIDLTIGLFCDEIMALYELSPHIFGSKNLIEDIAKTLVNMMLKGFAIHILRGRPLHCHSQLIKESIKFIPTTGKPPLVLTVIGEQSSAKSSLMNSTFGCNFRVSTGRCTIGMYMSVIQWKSETIVIFDTEGLLSLEEAGSIFDNQMVTMAVLSSHLVLINHKGEFSSNLKDLIGMSFHAKSQIQSPIKPKLLFILRDQADLLSKATFLRQLTQLKEQLQNESEFLKTSIDDELDINNENVYLLPNAFSHDVNPISNISQCWRNQTFPKEIIKLRDIIFKNITTTTKPQRFQPSLSTSNTTTTSTSLIDPRTPTIDPAYTDMTQLYMKISSNCETIDRLGPRLFECKTLYELSIMKELQAIAYDIIKKRNVTVCQDGENLIDETLLVFSRNNSIYINRDRIVEKFNYQLSLIITHAIDQAHLSFNDKTERSCYVSEIKSKVSKRLEPPIRSAQHLLKETFEGRLNDLLKKARVNDAQKQLLNSVQKEFDQNRSLQLDDFRARLEASFQCIIEQHHRNLESSFETETTIINKIFKFYNEQLLQLQCKQGYSTEENIYNILYLLTKEEQHKRYIQKFENCLSQSRRQANHRVVTKSSGLWNAFKSIFRDSIDKDTDSVWIQLKGNLGWFTNDKNEKKNKKIFGDLWNIILREFEENLFTLINDIKSVSSNPKTVQHLFQLIENAMNSQCIINNRQYLETHIFCSDLAVIGLNNIINEAIAKEKSDYGLNLENSTNEIKECKENLFKQITAMKDSFELGKTQAETTGKQIIDEIGKLLQRRIEKEIREDIFRSQFINHEAIQKQAYAESISQANGENILKYVYNINRYFIELSLREIKTTVHVVTHTHTLKFQHFIILAINKTNDFVQQCTFENTSELKDGIRNTILNLSDLKLSESTDTELYSMFSLKNIVHISIKDKDLFKKGFSSICNHYTNIEKTVADLTKSIKNEAFKRCKQSITQRLGCQARCPGCGAKCSKPVPHDNENVEIWQEPCKKCPVDDCTCKHPDPISVQTHEATHHLTGAFYGLRYYKRDTPCLEVCYQFWTTRGVQVSKKHQPNDSQNEENDDDDDSETVFPKAKYYNEYHPTWYNDFKRQSTEGNACKEKIPPPDQRRAWMVVRHALVNRYKHKMIDNKEYDEKLYPVNVESLPADFEPKWKDEDFE